MAGNFHVAPGRAFSSASGHLVHEFKPFALDRFNTSHEIHSLSFGPPYPDQVNPLDGVRQQVDVGSFLYQYYLKVVRTTYKPLKGQPVATSQYTVTETQRFVPPALPGHPGGSAFVLPGVFFIYDISPIMATYSEETRSVGRFLTSLCSIVGGVFVVAGMVDTALHQTMLRRAPGL